MAYSPETSRAEFSTAPTTLEGVWKISCKLFADDRGSVMEFYRDSDVVAAGLPGLGRRPQVNAPLTVRYGLRGIHAELAHKYVAVAGGVVNAAIVDLRLDQPTFGQWEMFELGRGDGLFVSAGFGNSFEALTADTYYLYYFSEEWRPDMPGLDCHPLDEELALPWQTPVDRMIISPKDLANPTLATLRGMGGVALL